MDKLPPELLDEISSHLQDSKDLNALRRVNRSFADILVTKTFPSYAFWLQRESIERLRKISEYSHFRNHLTHLRVPFELFYATFGDYKISLCAGTNICERKQRDSHCNCTKLSESSFNMIGEDGHDLHTSQLRASLTEVLRGLPQLSSLEMSGIRPNHASHRPVVTPRAVIFPEQGGAVTWWRHCGRAQFQLLMQAMSAAGDGFRLKTLRLKNDTEQFPETFKRLHYWKQCIGGIVHPSSSEYFKDYLKLAEEVLKHLETFEWDCHFRTIPVRSLNSYRIDGQLTIFYDGMNTLLRCMPALRNLSLTRQERWQSGVEIHLSRMFSDLTLTKLRSITLNKGKIDGLDLLDFARRHSGTLKHINLASMELHVKHTFKAFLHELRALLPLRHFIFDGKSKVYTRAKDAYGFPGSGNEREDADTRANLEALVRAVDDFVTRRIEEFPIEIIRRRLYHPCPRDFDEDNFVEEE